MYINITSYQKMSVAYEHTPTVDKSTILKTFNKHFFDFMDDIITIFPDNLDLETARASFETFRKANPTLLAKVWFNYVYLPYHDVIEAEISVFSLKKITVMM